MSSLSHEKSKCFGTWLHDYRLVYDTPLYVMEMCQRCKRQQVFKIVDGRVDNYEYIKHHNRQCLIPLHPLYNHEYRFNPYEQ